jgi:hypothetical protein
LRTIVPRQYSTGGVLRLGRISKHVSIRFSAGHAAWRLAEVIFLHQGGKPCKTGLEALEWKNIFS